MPDAVNARSVKILLEGPPKVGKTTAVIKLVQQLQDNGQAVGGFLTYEIQEDGRRVGFVIKDLHGPEAVLAHENLRSDVQVGRFSVDVTAVETVGLPAISRAVDLGGVVVVDEIARMELASTKFVAAIDRIMQSAATVIATVHVHPHPVTDALKAREHIELVTVTASNRDALVGQLFERLSRD